MLLMLPLFAARAAERWDHRGAVGLLLGGGLAVHDASRFGAEAVDRGLAAPLWAGLTLQWSAEDLEWVFAGGLSPAVTPEAQLDLWATAGLRDYFGDERLKTFLSLDLDVHAGSIFSVGPRLGVGLQYELSPVLGAFGQLAFGLGLGSGLRAGAQLLVGVQLRSYLLP